MSDQDRIPRPLIDDLRGYPHARVVEGCRAYPDIHMVDDRRAYHDIGVVEARRAYLGVPVVQDRRAYPDIREGLHMRGAPHPHPGILEEEFEFQEVEQRRLLADNCGLVEKSDALHRDIQAGKDEISHLNMIIADITTEKEDYINKLVDERRKLEAELRATEPLRDEVVQLHGKIDKLVAARKDLSAEVESLMQELAREKSGNQQLPMLEEQIDGLRQELVHVRTACALEHKRNFELVEQRNAMAQEIDQLRTELAKFEVRPWGTGGTYGMQTDGPKATFAASYRDSYTFHARGVSEKGSLLPPESSSWGKYDKNVSAETNSSHEDPPESSSWGKYDKNVVAVEDGATNRSHEGSRYKQPRWCPFGLTRTQKRKLQRLRLQEMREQRMENQRTRSPTK